MSLYIRLRHVFSVEGQSENLKWCFGFVPWLQGLSELSNFSSFNNLTLKLFLINPKSSLDDSLCSQTQEFKTACGSLIFKYLYLNNSLKIFD